MTAESQLVVLYVEEDERLARLTIQYLVAHGVDVRLVSHGDRAIAELIAVEPDIVLLDLDLPRLDGHEVCRQIREHTDVPIIVIATHRDEADRVTGIAADYLMKPFLSRDLLARLRRHARA